jgi:hypothetical protein
MASFLLLRVIHKRQLQFLEFDFFFWWIVMPACMIYFDRNAACKWCLACTEIAVRRWNFGHLGVTFASDACTTAASSSLPNSFRDAILSVHSQADLNKVALRLNQRPRKTLGFETPASKLQASVASTG